MKRLLTLVALAVAELLCVGAPAQTVTPILQPHQSFLDSNGLPCSLCSLYSYVGGTSTPQPTFTDSTGNTQNPNPLVLDATGSATIWVSNTLTYKFVLIDAVGGTVFTVDNVKASGGSVSCTTPYAVQFANSSATALACDPTITINPTSHTLMVGGAITGNSFTLKNLSTITTSWTLDVTSPTTALNSLGAIPLANLATQAQDSVVMNIAATGPPTAVPLPTGCTNGVNYSTTTHSWTCALASVPLTSLASQGPNTVVMNATGSTAVPTAVAMPTGCTSGVNYNTTTNAWTCVSTATNRVCTGSTIPYTCYKIAGDGTVEEWGVFYAPTGGATLQTVALSFPYAFPTAAELQVTGGSDPDGANDDAYSVYHRGLTNSGATVVIRCATNIGGSGCPSISNSIPIHWNAKGY